MSRSDGIDDEIRAARDRIRRMDQLIRKRETLAGEIAGLRSSLPALERELAKEDKDVARLERGGVVAFLAAVRGGKEDRLARERAEAVAARRRVESRRAKLGWLAVDRGEATRELARLGDPRKELGELLARKERMPAESGDPRGRQLAGIAERLAELEADLREHGEARAAGVAAGQAVSVVLQHLGAARRASTWDVFGGGVFADVVERGHLLRADEAAWHAQRALDVFGRELAGIGVRAAPRLPGVDTRWFADTFFDNIVTDVLKHRRIAATADAVQQVAGWVAGMLARIDARLERRTRERDALIQRREELLSGDFRSGPDEGDDAGPES
ncbi:hypothetical protein Pth03_48150 [Planotetraspora thailandica]|uniref:Uncharacterized protein n=1 Tax=Planotetraspora thailandica TaxID=487172 RepID=A0A8J3V411_9ACTN|nr:hypothetical protein [Planotetraspora thailandica]GII56426.1 hypothetical protein Pth03_48150 [Planotetraspora thailandica]